MDRRTELMHGPGKVDVIDFVTIANALGSRMSDIIEQPARLSEMGANELWKLWRAYLTFTGYDPARIPDFY
jgi:hypothetical protein